MAEIPKIVRDHDAERAAKERDLSARIFRMGYCLVMVDQEAVQEPGDDPDFRWHISISHPFRYPTWGEIGAARDALIPASVVLCVPFPPREWWVSVHPHCFHLWEIRDPNLREQWRFDGEGARMIGMNRPTPEAP